MVSNVIIIYVCGYINKKTIVLVHKKWLKMISGSNENLSQHTPKKILWYYKW